MRISKTQLFVLFAGLLFITSAETVFGQIGSSPGAFTRMGFGARGLSMGNAMTAVTNGDITSYYNPALSSFQDYRTFSASYSFLSLDRSLNFIHYTQSIKIYGKRFVVNSSRTDTVKTLQSITGISGGWINAGVSRIDGRDKDGFHTQDYSTSENQFYASFSIRFIENFSVGLAFKFYHYKLFEDITSSGLGIDLGVLYRLTNTISVGAMVQEINTEYRWDTGKLYGQQAGRTTTDKFPVLKRIGIACFLPDSFGIAAVDFENSDMGTNIFRVGIEVYPIDILTLRAGIDRLDISNTSNGVKPSFGFTLRKEFGGWTPAINYAYVFEPFAPSGMNVLSISLGF